jgi:cyanophycinase
MDSCILYFADSSRAIAHEDESRGDFSPNLITPRGYRDGEYDKIRASEDKMNRIWPRRLLELYQEGCVMAGTSAGAAVMSEIMITGEERRKAEEGHEFETLEAENIVTVEGLGFLKTVIIDQHFTTRKRHNRLISLVAEHPRLLGIGIDEETAVVVGPDDHFEVIGNRNVVVYDASKASVTITPAKAVSFRGMRMDVLVAGDRFDLEKRKAAR